MSFLSYVRDLACPVRPTYELEVQTESPQHPEELHSNTDLPHHLISGLSRARADLSQHTGALGPFTQTINPRIVRPLDHRYEFRLADNEVDSVYNPISIMEQEDREWHNHFKKFNTMYGSVDYCAKPYESSETPAIQKNQDLIRAIKEFENLIQDIKAKDEDGFFGTSKSAIIYIELMFKSKFSQELNVKV